MLECPVLSIHSLYCGPPWSSCDLRFGPKERRLSLLPLGGSGPAGWSSPYALTCVQSLRLLYDVKPWSWTFPSIVLSTPLLLSNLDGWYHWSSHPRPVSITYYMYLKPFSSFTWSTITSYPCFVPQICHKYEKCVYCSVVLLCFFAVCT